MRKGLLLLVCLLGAAWGQEFRATMTGRVTDTTSSVVPNAVVQVKNVGTNEVAATNTDNQGNYTVPFLRPGTYSVSVEVAGFKKFTRDGLVLNVGQTAAVNISLEVGAVTESVTVTAATPLLETAKADRGGVVDSLRVREIPLNARNPFMLSMMVAGVQYNGNAIYQRPFDNGAIAEWTINGSTSRSNEFLLDGVPNNAQAGGNNIALVPPVDAVEEFKIQTNSYDAQFGHTGGGIVNVSLRSGTNAFHGVAWEFARRNAWDANSFQNNAARAPRAGHFLDQYGFQVEGPIYFPKLYDGRNRSFFMMTLEDYHEGTPNPLNLSVAAPEFRTGDFSRLVDGRGQPIAIYDPTTGVQVGSEWRRTAFAGNRIPQNRINPIASKILNFMPQPNQTTPGQEYSTLNFFVAGGDNIAKDDFYNLALKFDQNIGDKHRIFFRHASNDRTETRNTNGIKEGPGQDGQHPLKRVNDAYVLDWVTTLSPTLILNVRTSFSRYIEGSRGDGNIGFDKTTLGFPASLVRQLPAGPFFGRYDFTGYLSLGRHFGFNYTNTFSMHPTVTKIWRGHSIKTGVDMRWIQYLTQNAGNPLVLSANRNFTQREFNRGDALSGNSIATWLLGTPTGGSVDYNLFPTHLYKYFSPYVQDDWKVTPRLTLNLGLRWDFNVSANERYDRLNRSFEPGVVNPADRLVDRRQFPTLPQLTGGLLFAGVGGVPRTSADLDQNNIQPRIGVAYQWRDKWVFRAGWGRTYLNPNNDYLQTNGFSQSTPYISSNDGGRTAISNRINDPFSDGVILPPGNTLGLATFLGRGFNFVNPRFGIPYVNQFSAGFQFELPNQSKVEVSYVGSRTKRMQDSLAFNEMDAAFRRRCNLMEAGSPFFCDERIPNPFQNLAPFTGTNHFTDTTLSRSQMARPRPHFTGLTEVTRNDGEMWYNSMQVVFETRSKAGINLLGTYTLSKQVRREGYLDVQNVVMQQGLTQWDRPHRLTAAIIYQLPFGQGKRLANTSHRVWNRLVSGWEATTFTIYQSGRPWDMPGNVLPLKEGMVTPDWSAPRPYGVRPCVQRWNDNGSITPQAYSVSQGCTDYNFLISPRFSPRFTPFRDGRVRLHSRPLFDVSLNKTTQITENTKIQFRAESFNVTNTYLFYAGGFVNNPEDANFGNVNKATVGFGSTTFPRHVQLGIKFIW